MEEDRRADREKQWASHGRDQRQRREILGVERIFFFFSFSASFSALRRGFGRAPGCSVIIIIVVVPCNFIYFFFFLKAVPRILFIPTEIHLNF